MAREDEDLGFDTHYFGDNTCINSDIFAELRDAAKATKKIRIATGVTNTVTRDASTVATSIAAVQVISGGRAICGIGKGDSAVGLIGRPPQRHAEFVESMQILRAYLRGESVRRGNVDSRIEWLPRFDYTPVPLEIAATGPRTIRTAAHLADRIMLNVGNAPERVRWALAIVDEGLAEAGRSRQDVRIGLALHVWLDNDPRAAAEQLCSRLAPHAHLASFAGNDLEAQPAILRRVTTQMRTAYDYRGHFRGDYKRSDFGNSGIVDAEFAAWFGLAGPASYAIERIHELANSGLDYFFFPPLTLPERERLAADVMPALRKLCVNN